MKIDRVQIDKEFEDDGLYAVTFWTVEDPPRYITLSRDEYEDSEKIYIEYIDQKYGFSTKEIDYSIDLGVLTIVFHQEKFSWNDLNRIDIEIPGDEIDSVGSVLIDIFNIKNN